MSFRPTRQGGQSAPGRWGNARRSSSSSSSSPAMWLMRHSIQLLCSLAAKPPLTARLQRPRRRLRRSAAALGSMVAGAAGGGARGSGAVALGPQLAGAEGGAPEQVGGAWDGHDEEEGGLGLSPGSWQAGLTASAMKAGRWTRDMAGRLIRASRMQTSAPGPDDDAGADDAAFQAASPDRGAASP